MLHGICSAQCEKGLRKDVGDIDVDEIIVGGHGVVQGLLRMDWFLKRGDSCYYCRVTKGRIYK